MENKNSLQVTNIQYAHEQYDSFVDIRFEMLNISDFKQRRQLKLNEECDAVFYQKTAHLQDSDFLELDRPVLEMIGFKNSFVEKKDKNGNLKVDEHGNIKIFDTRADFNNAARCLRNMQGFRESDSLDDDQADFVIKRAAHLEKLAPRGGSGLNKQEIWVRKRMLEHLVIMANTSNSRMIREYFLDLKRIMIEYVMYQTVYRSKYELSIKDTTIGGLRNDMQALLKNSEELKEKFDTQSQQLNEQSQQLHAQSSQLDVQTQKLDMLAKILYKETDNKVIDVNEKQKKQELVVLRKKKEPNCFEVLRGQKNHINQQVKRKQNDMEIVGKIDGYKNPINLFNRFGETIKTDSNKRFKKSSNKIVLTNGSTVDDLMAVFHTLDDEKHDTANNVKSCI